MKLLVNCDQVFDILTRGPFPTGEPCDEAVELHLRACHECRQLAEALRPAVELLHEAVSSDQAHCLPEYQGSLPPAQRPARQAAPMWKPGPPRSRKQAPVAPDYIRLLNAARFLAAGVLIAALGTLVLGLAMSPGPQANAVAPSGGEPDRLPAASYASQDPLITLAALRLPASCFPLQHSSLTVQDAAALTEAMAAGGEHGLRCCTECHNARQPQPPESRLIATTRDSCIACHRG
jgi:hypothetical protein